MAKVKIQGHASGTGVLTVTAPNTSTDRTITLPDATGTLLNSDGSAASLTAIPAANITGTLPAIDGSALTGITAPNHNLIINGEMQIAQRNTGTVATYGDTNEGFQTVDRWNVQFGGNPSGALTLSRDTESPAGFGHSLKIDCTTTGSASGNQTVYIKQPIEARDMRSCGWEYTSASSYITLSFWVRSSKTGTYCIALLDGDANDKMYTVEYTVSSANTWEKKSMSIPGHADLQFDDNVNLGLDVFFMFLNADLAGTANQWGSAAYGTSNQVNFLDSTSNVMYLTGVKLEVGNTATDYIHRSYAEELALCQRYFINLHSNVVYPGFANNAQTQFGVALPVPLRGSPTGSLTAGNKTTRRHNGSQDVTETAVTTASWGADRNVIGLGVSGFSSNTDGYAVNFGMGQGVLSLDSEI